MQSASLSVAWHEEGDEKELDLKLQGRKVKDRERMELIDSRRRSRRRL